MNHDGFIEPTEYANCKYALSCPYPRVPCDPETKTCVVKENPICPEGSRLDPTLDECIADPEINCPSGYRWDVAVQKCVRDPSCPAGSFDKRDGVCKIKPTLNCPSGYTLSGDVCVKEASCPSSGILDKSRGLCVLTPTLKCPSGWSMKWRNGKKVCTKRPECPSGFYFSENAGKCLKTALKECPSGYSYNSSTGRCERMPDCGSGGWWNSYLKACVTSAESQTVSESYYTCSLDGRRYSSYWSCKNNCTSTSYETGYVCSLNGEFYSSYWSCESNCKSTTYRTSWACTVNGQWYGTYQSLSECNAQCWGSFYLGSGCDFSNGWVLHWPDGEWVFFYLGPVGGTYVYGGCSSYSSSCSDGTCTYWPGALLNVMHSGSGDILWKTYEICYSCSETKRGVCTQQSSPETTYGTCSYRRTSRTIHGDCTYHSESHLIYTCPPGYSYDGSRCISHSPICPHGGSYDAWRGVCYREVTYKCPSGSWYDRWIEKCVTNPECGRGYLEGSECVMSPTKDCPSGYTLRGDECTKEVFCPDQAAFDSISGLCKLNPEKDCPSGYTYKDVGEVCEKDPDCSAGGTFDSKLSLCIKDPDIKCPPATSYAVKEKKCVVPPQCAKGIYNPETNLCEISEKCTGNWSCPIPAGSECKLISTKDSIESLNQFETHEGKKPFYDNDGEVSGEGCNGKVYIFNGYPMECLTAGIMTGFHNCCSGDCDGRIENYIDQSMESYGTLIDGTMAYKAIMLGVNAYKAYKAMKKLPTECSVNPVTNCLACGPSGSPWFNSCTGFNIRGILTADNIVSFIKNGLINIGIKGYLASMAAGFATDLAFKTFFGGCSAQDDLTVCYKKHGLCHYVGSYCKESWPLVGCVQRAKVYCCFSSKLARIVHEQGRPQLKTFGKNKLLMWGDPEDSPNCRGFTPQEFQMLDFSRIDFSEWYADINAKAQETIKQSLEKSVKTLEMRSGR